ncbi:MAG: bifunctional 4-hydroxy-2-oxoglutarate aldolase/2-dehydro-3-deoxy-phosphogluconate aldolase [Pyrinomonadaceae bacterium]
MNKLDVLTRIRACGVLPVIRAASADDGRKVVDALVEGGIDTIEVTMTVPNAVGLIADLVKSFGGKVVVGAGTVMDAETARECIAVGARFIISPATNFDTILHCNEAEIVVMPGALTPTEVANAWAAGADIVKIFPANAMGGASYLRSLKAPLPDIKLIPTGGVDQSNAAEFIRGGAEAVGVGADLVDVKSVNPEGRAALLTSNARKYLEIIRIART